MAHLLCPLSQRGQLCVSLLNSTETKQLVDPLLETLQLGLTITDVDCEFDHPIDELETFADIGGSSTHPIAAAQRFYFGRCVGGTPCHFECSDAELIAVLVGLGEGR